MTPPPSATANADMAYDPEMVHAMMAELEAAQIGPIRRAFTALALIGLGAFILLSVLSYNPFDSTFDTAGLNGTRNWLGGLGANIGNIAMQTLGLGAVLLALLTLFTGIRIFIRPLPYQSRLDRFRRMSLWVGTVLFGTITVAAFPIPQDWPLATGLGGWVGDLVFLNLRDIFAPFNIPFTSAILAMLTFIITVFCMGQFMRIVATDLIDVADAAGLVWAYIRMWTDKLAARLARIFRKLFKTAYVDDVATAAGTDNLFRDVPETATAAPKPKTRVKPKAAPKPVAKAKAAPQPKPKAKPKKPKFHFPEGSDFVLPSVDLLKTPPPRATTHDPGALTRSSQHLHKVMGDYGIEGDMGDVRPGPVVTLFEFEPANAMILSLMYRLPPEQCKFIMIDPKMLELSVYDGAPHLLAPVVTEPKKAVVALKWTVREMEDRYRKMAKMNVRNMAGFNEKVAEFKASGETMTRTVMTGYNKESGEPEYETEELEFEPMPYIVVIIDEMADLMMVAKKDIEGSVQRLAQMARAAGIHVIMATQRPSTDVITGTIKANFPARICFRVGSKIDSRVILGEQGGESLLGNGDMLFAGTGRARRLHGPFVSDGEVEKIAEFVKAQGAPSYLDDITTEREEAPSDPTKAGGGSEGGSLFDQAVAIVARDRKASTSYIQRKLSIGYNRAADLIERMEGEGIIGPSGSGGKREIFLPEEDDPFN